MERSEDRSRRAGLRLLIMHWKRKALIQRTCAALPFAQEALYYQLQRTFGSLRHKPDPIPMLEACADLAAGLIESGVPVRGARMMEIGSGRRLDMPLTVVGRPSRSRADKCGWTRGRGKAPEAHPPVASAW